jgi:hypothetical protein
MDGDERRQRKRHKEGHRGLQAVDFLGSQIVNSFFGMEEILILSIDLVRAGALVLALLAAGRQMLYWPSYLHKGRSR